MNKGYVREKELSNRCRLKRVNRAWQVPGYERNSKQRSTKRGRYSQSQG